MGKTIIQLIGYLYILLYIFDLVLRLEGFFDDKANRNFTRESSRRLVRYYITENL